MSALVANDSITSVYQVSVEIIIIGVALYRKLNDNFVEMVVPAGHQIHKMVQQSFQVS